ncbi:uncharacterized protein LOC110458957 isoform X1 [Mizuhopecten yessoensis]|uniref:uncharacterized protein LOC110458957 isoform X1 n=1 Tax=Mizuhopecten yessoensis TaxID=6573 RepID=UPI000B45C917|nr:uncharacterized protein LOC110458957 isoform X1 [Mizuhopecten yessoensis]
MVLRTECLTSGRKELKQKLKVTDSHGKCFFWIATNPNINSRELKEKFQESFGALVSDSLMRRVQRKLGWQTRTTIQYCQLITNMIKKRRPEYSLNALGNREDFKNVVFVDDSSVEMSSSGKMYFYKNGNCFDRLPTKAPKPKHAYKRMLINMLLMRT